MAMRVPRLLKHFFGFVLLAALVPAQAQPSSRRLDLTTQQSQPSVDRDGDTIHVVGTDIAGAISVCYARSLDGGRTWPVHDQVLAPNAGPASVTVAGDRVFVAIQSGVGRSLLASFDAGNTWQPPVALPSGHWLPEIHVDGLAVNVFCVGSTFPGQGLFLVRSADGGHTWATPVDLSAGLPTGFTTSDDTPQVLADGSVIHVFWNHRTPLIHLAHQWSLDGGATWLSTAQVLTNAPLVGAGFGAGRLLVQAGSTLWSSTNHGSTWSPLVGHGFAFPATLAMEGSRVLVVEAAPWPSGFLLRMAVSVDAGITWSVSASTIAGNFNPYAEAAVVGNTMFAWYWKSSVPGFEIVQSDDDGATWRTIVGTASEVFLPGRDGGVALTSYPNTPGIWAWVLEGHMRYGVGNPGTAGVVPTLSGRGLAGIGLTFRLDLENAVGGALAAYVFGLGSNAFVPIGPNTRLLVAQTFGSSVVVASGTPGLAGAGTASFAVPIPNLTSLIGFGLRSQAFVVDPGAPDGFCATAARESWIR